MGAWDYGALDNDPALEVLDRWKQWIDEGMGYEAGIDHFFRYWGDAVNYGDSVTNAEIIALAAIHLNKALPVPDRLRKAAVNALNRELVADELRAWAEPARREEALLRMLSTLGGKRRIPRPPTSFNDPTVQYRNTAEARAALMKLAHDATERMRQRGHLGFVETLLGDTKLAPPFLQTVHRLMMHRIWEKDWNIEEQASLERRMMLAWYVAMTSGGTVEDVAAALDGCRRKTGS